jgi:tetratricopeptide (TPR) repeat protein
VSAKPCVTGKTQRKARKRAICGLTDRTGERYVGARDGLAVWAHPVQLDTAMSNEVLTRGSGLPHAVFLQRVAEEPTTSPEVRLGQGAFLALRFVDLLAPDREPPTLDVFRYQWAATERYCAELAGEGTEAAHLSCIVRATGEAHRTNDIQSLAPALFAYALYLEQEYHLHEAADALETMIRVGADRIQTSQMIAAWLRLGRVLRKQADFERALKAYTEAGQIAQTAGDGASVLLSRIGQCNVIYFRGNLAEAEQAWQAIVVDASRIQLREIQAQAEHGLGNVLARRGQPHKGASHLWRAYELYEDEMQQLRTLNDLGLLLLSIGKVADAEKALLEVVRREKNADNLANAKIELMNCASFRRDRVSFERWRERALDHMVDELPNIRADFHLKAGLGLARFGSYHRAEQELRRAHEIATAHGLHELVFRIERMKEGLQNCQALDGVESPAVESVADKDALRDVSASLAALSPS